MKIYMPSMIKIALCFLFLIPLYLSTNAKASTNDETSPYKALRIILAGKNLPNITIGGVTYKADPSYDNNTISYFDINRQNSFHFTLGDRYYVKNWRTGGPYKIDINYHVTSNDGTYQRADYRYNFLTRENMRMNDGSVGGCSDNDAHDFIDRLMQTSSVNEYIRTRLLPLE